MVGRNQPIQSPNSPHFGQTWVQLHPTRKKPKIAELENSPKTYFVMPIAIVVFILMIWDLLQAIWNFAELPLDDSL